MCFVFYKIIYVNFRRSNINTFPEIRSVSEMLNTGRIKILPKTFASSFQRFLLAIAATGSVNAKFFYY
jgi:hypothetical protein